ncbi:MAG TPA: hypothetical protein VE136_05665 [Anaerolineales bacterium]|jgi:putative membrane protein|nr:hypothetical protein [Anaerolineales bacterium]
MSNGFCDVGTLGFLGDFSLWSSIGLILNLIFWAGLIAGLTLLVVLAIRRARAGGAGGASASAQPTAKEILQARYARGEITREQYQLGIETIG